MKFSDAIGMLKSLDLYPTLVSFREMEHICSEIMEIEAPVQSFGILTSRKQVNPIQSMMDEKQFL